MDGCHEDPTLRLPAEAKVMYSLYQVFRRCTQKKEERLAKLSYIGVSSMVFGSNAMTCVTLVSNLEALVQATLQILR